MVSFSLDAETFLNRIYLEDPKSAASTGYLEQSILAIANRVIACVPWFSFETKPLALTFYADTNEKLFSFWLEVEHLCLIKSHLHPANSCNVLPLVEPLHFELI